jgi:hypothetical protein
VDYAFINKVSKVAWVLSFEFEFSNFIWCFHCVISVDCRYFHRERQGGHIFSCFYHSLIDNPYHQLDQHIPCCLLVGKLTTMCRAIEHFLMDSSGAYLSALLRFGSQIQRDSRSPSSNFSSGNLPIPVVLRLF